MHPQVGEGDPGRGEVTAPGTGRLKDFGDGVERRPLAPQSPPIDPVSSPDSVAHGSETLKSCFSGMSLSFLLKQRTLDPVLTK